MATMHASNRAASKIWGLSAREQMPRPAITLRLTRILLIIVPLLVGSTMFIDANGSAALACGAAAGAVVVAWPWWQLYRAMREHEREHPAERRRPWWQRWPWGSPPIPRPKTGVDRFFDGWGFLSGGTLGLFVLAWLSGLL